MVDGIVFAGRCFVVAMVIIADGTKIPVGLYGGDTDNKTVVTGLLADVVDRGLRFKQGILCIIDESKALAGGTAANCGKSGVDGPERLLVPVGKPGEIHSGAQKAGLVPVTTMHRVSSSATTCSVASKSSAAKAGVIACRQR